MVRRLNEARIGRTKSVYVSQEYVPSYGWEDITVYDDMSPESLRLAKQDVKDYRDNGYNARYITRKLNNPDYVEPTYELSEEAVIDWLENECPYEYEIKDGMYGKWVYIGKDVAISLPNGPDSIFDNNIKITDNYERRTYRVNTLDELKKKVDRILKKREKIKADLIAAGYGNFVESRTRKRSIKEDMEDKKYKAYAYIGLHRRNGLMDSIVTDDFEELRDWCWEKIHDGVWLSVDNDETGSYACLELPEDAEYLDYYDLDDCIIRKDSAKEIVSFDDLY